MCRKHFDEQNFRGRDLRGRNSNKFPHDWHSSARWSFDLPQAQKLAHCRHRLVRRSERIVAEHFSQFFGMLQTDHLQAE